MVYQKKFVVVVKHNGKILRGQDDNTVYLPFNSEYSVVLKNLNSRDAVASISIDGQSIGNDLIIKAGDTVEVERFIQDLDCGHRFRFIQKTREISDHRGDRLDDGLIRVEYRFQVKKPAPVINIIPFSLEWPHAKEIHHHYHYFKTYGYPRFYWPEPGAGGAIWGNVSGTLTGGPATYGMNMVSGEPVTANFCADAGPLGEASVKNMRSLGEPVPQEGITVKGSESNQQFSYGHIGQLEEYSEVIILRLRGITHDGRTPISHAITVKTKLECSTCGRKSTSSSTFCSHCGTALF